MKSFQELPFSTVENLVISSIQESSAMKPPSFAKVYARMLSSIPINRVLEIGIHKANSLKMWRQLCSSEVEIIAIDIKPESCALANGIADFSYCGSQVDAKLIQSIIDKHGPFDIVIDDGSHLNQHMIASLNMLFPAVAEGGFYLIEDVFTSYWPSYKGGYKSPGSLIETMKDLIDSLFQRFSTSKYERQFKGGFIVPIPTNDNLNGLKSIGFHDAGLIVLEKN